MFKYDHSLLSLVELQRKGIRNTKVLEEVIEGQSFASVESFKDLDYSVIIFTGFSSRSQAIKVVCRLENSGRIVTLDAEIPTVDEVTHDFCKYTKL